MIKNMWYALEFSHEITATPKQAVCLGQKLVLYRTPRGKVVCMSDLCVHRGAQLSQGTTKGDCIVCPYHGWEYEPDGACTRIPAHPEKTIPRKARVDSYPVEERYGFVWVFLGDLPAEERPPIPEWPEFEDPRFRPVYGTFEWPANFARIVENGIDPSHAPFVHGGVFGNPEQPEVPDFEITETPWMAKTQFALPAQKPRGLWSKVSSGKKDLKSRPPVIVESAWYLPNLIKLDVHLPLGRLVIYDTNIPVSETQTRVLWVALRNFFPQKVFDRDTRRRVMRIFVEDEAVVSKIRPELLPFDLSAELHVRSDALAIAYRRRLFELMDQGWGIDSDHVMGDQPTREAVVIPSPARREIPELRRAWVLKSVPVRKPNPVEPDEREVRS